MKTSLLLLLLSLLIVSGCFPPPDPSGQDPECDEIVLCNDGFVCVNGFCEIDNSDPVCGNGILETGEECDDNNEVSGDGCSSICENEGSVESELNFYPDTSNFDYVGFVQITSNVPGAQIFYTLDGSTPTENSNPYFMPVQLDKTTTIKAISKNPDGSKTQIDSKTYVFNKVPQDSFNLEETYNYIEAEATKDYHGFYMRPAENFASNNVYAMMMHNQLRGKYGIDQTYSGPRTSELKFSVVPQQTDKYNIWVLHNDEGVDYVSYWFDIDGSNEVRFESNYKKEDDKNWGYIWKKVKSSIKLNANQEYVMRISNGYYILGFDKILITNDLDYIPPTINLISPNGFERFVAGSDIEIQWKSHGDLDKVKIEYSLDGKNSWITITDSTENDGVYVWQTPNIITSTVAIKISGTDKKVDYLQKESDAHFSLVSSSNINPFDKSTTFRKPFIGYGRIDPAWYDYTGSREDFLLLMENKGAKQPTMGWKDPVFTMYDWDLGKMVIDVEAIEHFKKYNEDVTLITPYANLYTQHSLRGEAFMTNIEDRPDLWLTDMDGNIIGNEGYVSIDTDTGEVYDGSREGHYFGSEEFVDWWVERAIEFVDVGVDSWLYDSFNWHIRNGENYNLRAVNRDSNGDPIVYGSAGNYYLDFHQVEMLNKKTNKAYTAEEYWDDIHYAIYEIDRKLDAHYNIKDVTRPLTLFRYRTTLFEFMNDSPFKAMWYEMGFGSARNPPFIITEFINDGAMERDLDFISLVVSKGLFYQMESMVMSGEPFNQDGNQGAYYNFVAMLMAYHPEAVMNFRLTNGGTALREWDGLDNIQTARFVPLGKFERIGPNLFKREFQGATIYLNSDDESHSLNFDNSYYYLKDDGAWSSNTISSKNLDAGRGLILVKEKVFS